MCFDLCSAILFYTDSEDDVRRGNGPHKTNSNLRGQTATDSVSMKRLLPLVAWFVFFIEHEYIVFVTLPTAYR